MDDWRGYATCRTLPVDLFFPEPDDDPAPALAACAVCPVRAECHTEFDTDRHAIAGGYTAEQRRALRNGRPLPPAYRGKRCARCDNPFQSPQPAAKYCPGCRPVVRAEQLRDQSRRREARHPHRCADCRRRFETSSLYIRHRCQPSHLHLADTEGPR